MGHIIHRVADRLRCGRASLLEQRAWQARLPDDRHQRTCLQLRVEGNRHRDCPAACSPLHSDVAPTASYLNEAVVPENATDIWPGEDSKPPQR